MLAAYIIGLILNTDIIDFDTFLKNSRLQKGSTRRTKKNLQNPWDAENILIVDDSILSGKSLSTQLNKIPKKVKKNFSITTLAIYSSKIYRKDVDIFFSYIDTPRIFEWNLFHRDILSKSCVDIDGVLCLDPSKEENDDGKEYENFILNATPLILPTYEINSLVTNRLEKYRKQTVIWLKKNNIRFKKLIMLDVPSQKIRIEKKLHTINKSNYYKSCKLDLFIESDPLQAIEIARNTKKPVYCLETNKIYNASDLRSLLKYTYFQKKYVKKIIKLFPRTLLLVMKIIFKK